MANDTESTPSSEPAETEQPRIEIVLVNYNGLEDTLICLRSLQALEYRNYGVTLVDNDSIEDPMPHVAREFPDVVRLSLPRNTGCSGGNNAGIRRARPSNPEFYLLLNNDTTVSPDMLAKLVVVARQSPEYGIIGPLIGWMEDPGAVMKQAGRFNAVDDHDFFEYFCLTPDSPDAPPRLIPMDLVNGCCMFVRASVFDRVGLIDDTFFLQHEETELCLRAVTAGIPNGVLPQILVLHKGSASFEREGASGSALKAYYATRNLFRLLLRYHGGPGKRGLIRALGRYAVLTHDRRSFERSQGQIEASDGHVFGLVDALKGRTGGVQTWPKDRPFRLVSTAFNVAESASRLKP